MGSKEETEPDRFAKGLRSTKLGRPSSIKRVWDKFFSFFITLSLSSLKLSLYFSVFSLSCSSLPYEFSGQSSSPPMGEAVAGRWSGAAASRLRQRRRRRKLQILQFFVIELFSSTPYVFETKILHKQFKSPRSNSFKSRTITTFSSLLPGSVQMCALVPSARLSV